ncbi:hypothetical protein F5Y15DRAFT_35898 [Xylariaceae sp. FL0016]|nr:hypothetical protein F5Y15DRAFT_35898 [Xylariaceae sp. FL0016]
MKMTHHVEDRRPHYDIYYIEEPLVGKLLNIISAVFASSVCAVFLFHRLSQTSNWRRVHWIEWILLLMYIDSWVYVLGSVIIQYAFNVNENAATCAGATLLCLVAYSASKFLIYLFLIDRAHIVRGSGVTRRNSKLYLFNTLGIMSVTCVSAVLVLVFRFSRFENGICIIGVKQDVMFGTVSFDVFVEIYLTASFILPLAKIFGINFRRPPGSLSLGSLARAERPVSARLRTLAIKSFLGAFLTLCSSVSNLASLMILDGEPAWLCLLTCNLDIIFSACVMFWVTMKDSPIQSTNSSEQANTQSTLVENRENTPKPEESSPPAVELSPASLNLLRDA